jgi:hypothetical protein
MSKVYDGSPRSSWEKVRQKTGSAMVKAVIATLLVVLCSYGASGPDPLSAREAAINLVSDQGLEKARDVIAQMLSQSQPVSTPYQLTYLAELMKLIGDPRASATYREAIGKGADDPAIELLFGEYMRNFRGPMQPMAGEAELHLFEATRKLACAEQKGATQGLGDLQNQLKRSIVTLYERDGLPIYSWMAKQQECKARAPGISLFFSAGVRGGEGITDLDVDSDIRDLTSAAAYSQSLRTNLGPLSPDLLRGFLRTVTPVENRNRLRMRYKGTHLDVLYNYRNAGNAAITDPDLTDQAFLSNRDLVRYNALTLNQFGLSVGNSFHLFGSTDADVEATYSRVYRTGLVDYLPNVTENINQVEANAIVSRFVGPDKVNAAFTFLDQSITPAGTSYGTRGRQIYAGTIRYQIYRLGSGYDRFFRGTRGLELYGGAMHDHENFGYQLPALVNRDDYFAGATVHAIGRLVDLSLQPTWFNYTVPQDSSRNSRQYRTAAYGLIRLVDEERVGPNLPPEWHGWHLGFVHLTVPIQSDSPLQGLPAFADRKVGVELAAKWFTTARATTTFLGSARYDVQRFTNLNRTFSLFTLSASMGF